MAFDRSSCNNFLSPLRTLRKWGGPKRCIVNIVPTSMRWLASFYLISTRRHQENIMYLDEHQSCTVHDVSCNFGQCVNCKPSNIAQMQPSPQDKHRDFRLWVKVLTPTKWQKKFYDFFFSGCFFWLKDDLQEELTCFRCNLQVHKK